MDRLRIYIFGSVGMLALGAGGYFWQSSVRGDLEKEYKKYASQVRDEGEVTKQLLEAKAKVQESSTKIEHLEAGVPASAYIPTLLQELETLGKEKGLQITGIRPQPPEKKKEKPAAKDGQDDKAKKKKAEPVKAYQEWIIEVKGRGSYQSVLSFVSALESFPKIIGVMACDLQPVNKNKRDLENDNRLDMTVDLKAYVFPIKEDTGLTANDKERTHDEG
ncbi:MAG: type 4a pilus biogenesis protein PilO [Armatimonadetes bacterium]|nr:type 4a pilus biogenesis protein PilO [Armatimonadota bacterium]